MIDPIGSTAATLSLIEVGLGSLLHAVHWPLSGQALSLNQGFFLARAEYSLRTRTDIRWASLRISTLVALLKSMSPAGSRLTPMLAISIQGLLFNLGTFVLGRGPAGLILGMTLLGFWAIFQPLIMTAFFYGGTLTAAATQLFHFIERQFPGFVGALGWGLVALIVLKTLIGWSLVVAAIRIPEERLKPIENLLTRLGHKAGANRVAHPSAPRTTWGSRALDAVRDLVSPYFLIPLALTAGYAWYERDASVPQVWLLMRPIALAWLAFFIVRSLPIERWLKKVR